MECNLLKQCKITKNEDKHANLARRMAVSKQREAVLSLHSGSLFEVVVVDFDGEDDYRADEGDYVCDPYRPDAGHYSDNDEESRADAHHHEGRHGDSVGVTGPYCCNRLRHIAQNH